MTVYLSPTTGLDKKRPISRDTLNYYVFEYGLDKALCMFKLTEKKANDILYDFNHGGIKIGFKHIKEPKYEQGNINPK